MASHESIKNKSRPKLPLPAVLIGGVGGGFLLLTAFLETVADRDFSIPEREILKIGDQGPDVAELQNTLRKKAPQCYQSSVTGFYGEATERGVKFIQDVMHFPVPEKDGRWGPKTESRFNTDSHFQIKK